MFKTTAKLLESIAYLIHLLGGVSDVVACLYLFFSATGPQLLFSCCLIICGIWMDFVQTANGVLSGRLNSGTGEKSNSTSHAMIVFCIILMIFGVLASVAEIIVVIQRWMDLRDVLRVRLYVC